MHQRVRVVGQVADRSYAARHMEKAVTGLHMHMHVPEAGHQRFAGCINSLSVFRERHLAVSAYGSDLVARTDYCAIRQHLRGFGIEQVGMNTDQWSFWFVSQRLRQLPR